MSLVWVTNQRPAASTNPNNPVPTEFYMSDSYSLVGTDKTQQDCRLLIDDDFKHYDSTGTWIPGAYQKWHFPGVMNQGAFLWEAQAFWVYITQIELAAISMNFPSTADGIDIDLKPWLYEVTVPGTAVPLTSVNDIGGIGYSPTMTLSPTGWPAMAKNLTYAGRNPSGGRSRLSLPTNDSLVFYGVTPGNPGGQTRKFQIGNAFHFFYGTEHLVNYDFLVKGCWSLATINP